MGMIHSDENGTMTPLARIMARYERKLPHFWTPQGEKTGLRQTIDSWGDGCPYDAATSRVVERQRAEREAAKRAEAANPSPDASFTDAAKRAGLFGKDRKPLL